MRISTAAALCAAVALGGAAAADAPLDANALYPEGPLWHDGRLLVAEMGADRIAAFHGVRKRVVWSEPGCGPTSISSYGAGILVLCHLRREVVALDATFKAVRRWSEAGGVAFQDPNDSSADDSGGVYFSDPGVFSVRARPTGAVVHLSKDGRTRRVATGLRYPNGVYFDASERALYVDEHLARRVLKFPVSAGGELGAPSVFADIDELAGRRGDYAEAGPDGLERGPDGDLYVCLYGEGRVVRLSPTGALIQVYDVPTPYVTNIAFGPDGVGYVTGSYENVAPNLRGAVFRLHR